MITLHTIGHGTRSPDDLIAALSAASVVRLVDVRRFPGSRRHPHFARDAMERWLPEHGIAYEWWGESLGGRRSNATGSRHHALRNSSFRSYADHMDGGSFRTALQRLEALGAEEAVAVMCAETLWWRCHRKLVADALVARGHRVIHILDAAKRQEHRPPPEMRVDEDGYPVYDLGTTARLTIEP